MWALGSQKSPWNSKVGYNCAIPARAAFTFKSELGGFDLDLCLHNDFSWILQEEWDFIFNMHEISVMFKQALVSRDGILKGQERIEKNREQEFMRTP